MSDRTVRFGGVAAIIFVVLVMITIFSAGSPPAADDPVDKIRAFMVDHRSALLLANFLGLVATGFVIWFFIVLREILRGDALTNALGTATLAGVLITAPMAMAGGALSVAPFYADGVVDKLGDDTIRVVFEAQSLMFATTSAGIVLLALGAGLAIRRTGALPSYTMWLAYLAVVGNIITMFSILDAGAATLGLAGILSFSLFLLVTGITMAMGKATPAASG